MKFGVFGTGGVGGYFGGMLAQAGYDVTFIARGEHLAKITESGLRVDSIGGDFVVKSAKATDSPQSVGVVDCVIVATKSWQLKESIEQLSHLVGERTMILPLLNGIEHIDLLVNSFGNHVLGGMCRISSFLVAPGHITHVAVKPVIVFGELDNQTSERVQTLRDIFSSMDGIVVETPEDIQVAMWEKFIFICATSGVGAVTRQTFDVFRSISETRAMFRSALAETTNIGRAKEIALADDLVDTLMKRMDNTPVGMVASMQKDIIEGRPSELEAQTGAVIRLGREMGIPTPTHEFIYASLLPMEIRARNK